MGKRWIILFTLAVVQGICSQTIRQTVNIALKNNKSIRASVQQVHSAAEISRTAKQRSLPGLQFSSRASYITDIPEIDLQEMTGLPLGSFSLGARESYETSLKASWVLFSGFAQKAGIRTSEKQLELARINHSKTEKEIALQTVSVYLQIQGYMLKISSLESAAERVQIKQKKLKSLAGTGMVLGLDTLTIALSELKLRQETINAQSNLKTAQQQLDLLAGEKIRTSSALPDIHESVPELQLDEQDLLKGLDMQYQINQQARILSKSKFYPTIAVQASMNYGRPGADFIQNQWMTYGSAGIALQWEIWNWGANRSAARAHTASIRRVQYQTENARDQIQLQYDRALRELTAMRDQLKIYTETVNIASEKLRLIRIQSDNGMASISDFDDANLELTQAEIGLQGHRINVARKIIEIDYLCGMNIDDWHIN